MKAPAAAPARPKRPSRSSRRPRAATTGAPFRAFIAYADIPAARRAMGEIRDVLLSTAADREFRPMPWRFDQLAKESWSEVSLRDAADAAIVVLASTESELPIELERWLGMLLARKHRSATTIVAVLGATEAWTISVEKTEAAAAAKAPSTVNVRRSAMSRAPAACAA